MDQTARFAIPLLAPGQAQKEFFHNEALERVATLLCPVAEGPPQSNPPSDPAVGTCCLIATGATGDWTGKDGSIACFTAGGWRFVQPVEGVGVVEQGAGEEWRWRSGMWERGVMRGQEVHINGQKVLHQRQPAIAEPAGGEVIDAESRAAVRAILTALRAHGLID